MRNKKIILKKLENIFQIIFDDEQIKLSDETTASDIEEWDSLNQIKIILACEKEFLVKLNPREINNFSNVKEMVEHLYILNAKI
jgi:acyl carrier protein